MYCQLWRAPFPTLKGEKSSRNLRTTLQSGLGRGASRRTHPSEKSRLDAPTNASLDRFEEDKLDVRKELEDRSAHRFLSGNMVGSKPPQIHGEA